MALDIELTRASAIPVATLAIVAAASFAILAAWARDRAAVGWVEAVAETLGPLLLAAAHMVDLPGADALEGVAAEIAALLRALVGAASATEATTAPMQAVGVYPAAARLAVGSIIVADLAWIAVLARIVIREGRADTF